MTGVVNFFVDPLNLFWVALLSAAVLFWCNFKKLSRALSFFALAWIFTITISPIPQWLIYNLEHKYEPWRPEPQSVNYPVHILILGGGHSIAPELPSTGQLMSSALGRITEGIRIHRLIASSKLICSGNSQSKRTTQAEMLANAAVELGVFPVDTLQLRRASNTQEELLEYKKRFGIERKVILVTSAFHMPRAIAICQLNGIDAIPAPADFYLKKDPSRGYFDFRPSVSKISMMQMALHEQLGLLWLRSTSKAV